MSEECHELKNIKYKTMLLTGKNNEVISSISKDMTNLDLFIEKEKLSNTKEPWNKLDKCIKLHKINEYIKKLKEKHHLDEEEIINLKEYLISCIDKKSLSRNKDIDYEKDSGIINNIPQLYFNNNTRKFTLKKHDKHVSTAKCLGPPKRKKSPKTTRKLSPRED
jgi:hypothetical protein